ncbi:MAG: hypothetical protein HC842_07350 [Cytophagales bacterium]|nr:hypothetical protein [Cytophagales bacterium]
MNKIGVVVMWACCLVACNSKQPQLAGVDLERWKSDPHGCQGLRKALLPVLWEQKNQTLGLSQNQVKALLGKPDRHELYERNQKFFLYYVEPDGTCPNAATGAQALEIRFNAVGLSAEANLVQP